VASSRERGWNDRDFVDQAHQGVEIREPAGEPRLADREAAVADALSVPVGVLIEAVEVVGAIVVGRGLRRPAGPEPKAHRRASMG